MLSSRAYLTSRPTYDVYLANWIEANKTTQWNHAVDVGCGPGNSTLWLSRLAHKVIGIDPSLEMLSIAENVSKKQTIDNVAFAHGSSSSFNTGISCFDAVVAASCFEWFYLPEFKDQILKHTDDSFDVILLWSWPDNRNVETKMWYEWFRQCVGARLGPEPDELLLRAVDFLDNPSIAQAIHGETYNAQRLGDFIASSSYYHSDDPERRAAMLSKNFLGSIARSSINLMFRQYAVMGTVA